jgi:hypothetical protein
MDVTAEAVTLRGIFGHRLMPWLGRGWERLDDTGPTALRLAWVAGLAAIGVGRRVSCDWRGSLG